MPIKVTMPDSPCDRCGKVAPILHPYRLVDAIKHQGKWIVYPWLCMKCIKAEKRKQWAGFYEDLGDEYRAALAAYRAVVGEAR